MIVGTYTICDAELDIVNKYEYIGKALHQELLLQPPPTPPPPPPHKKKR